MISKEFIYEKVLPHIKDNARMLEYYLIQSLFENKDEEIIEALKSFQNEDGGFGNGLEPDVQMPDSSVLATCVAIKALDFVREHSVKEQLVKDVVTYLEHTYDETNKRFHMVSKQVDQYPHAIWWNYTDLDKNFPFGNPDPEVIGFLFKHKKYMTKLNYSQLINQVVTFVLSDKFLDASMHTLMSVLRFYKSVDDDVKNLIHDRIHLLVNKLLAHDKDNWDEYGLEPYKIYIIEPHFVNTHLEELGKNLTKVINQITSLNVMPNWNWFQYEEVFETVRHDWIGSMYFEMIRAMRMHRVI